MPRVDAEVMVASLANELGVDPALARLLLQKETGGTSDPLTALSKAGARGPLQVMPDTGAELAAKHGFDFNTPEGQTKAGLIYYRNLLDQFGGDPAIAAAAYHSGPGRVQSIQAAGGDLGKELGPAGRDYYQFFKDKTAGQGNDWEDVPTGQKPTTALQTDSDWEDVKGGQAALRGAETIRPTPALEQNIKLPLPTPGLNAELPFSAIDAIEAIPGIGGTLGALLSGGNPAGAGLGATAGEAGRQLIRRLLGYPAATGRIQEKLKLDPNSPAAAALGLGIEGALGAGGEAAVGALASKAPGLREGALKTYAGMLPSDTAQEAARTVEALRPIQEELPMLAPYKPRKGLERWAEKKAGEVGPQIEAIYGTNQPSSLGPVINRLQDAQLENTRVLGHTTAAGKVVEPIPKSKGLDAALKDRQAETEAAQQAFESLKGGPAIKDIHESRKTADELARLAKADVFDRSARELQPRVRALREERQALRDILHSEVSGGKEVDDLFHAYKTAQDAGQASDAGSFMQRWLVGRLVSGPVGTIGGAAATQSAFWRSLGSKTQRGLANALEVGDKAKLIHWLRAASTESETRKKPFGNVDIGGKVGDLNE